MPVALLINLIFYRSVGVFFLLEFRQVYLYSLQAVRTSKCSSHNQPSGLRLYQNPSYGNKEAN